MHPECELNQEAARSATEVECPFCHQQPGQTCVTTSLNEAAFTHMVRVNLRKQHIIDARGKADDDELRYDSTLDPISPLFDIRRWNVSR